MDIFFICFFLFMCLCVCFFAYFFISSSGFPGMVSRDRFFTQYRQTPDIAKFGQFNCGHGCRWPALSSIVLLGTSGLLECKLHFKMATLCCCYSCVMMLSLLQSRPSACATGDPLEGGSPCIALFCRMEGLFGGG